MRPFLLNSPPGPQQFLGPSSSSTPGCTTTVIVANGDVCWQIQQQFGLTKAQFLQLNPAVSCTNLLVGQPLCVATPTLPPPTPCRLSHYVTAMDTCTSISRDAKLKVSELQALNPGLSCTNLTALRTQGPVCIKNDIITPPKDVVYCSG